MRVPLPFRSEWNFQMVKIQLPVENKRFESPRHKLTVLCPWNRPDTVIFGLSMDLSLGGWPVRITCSLFYFSINPVENVERARQPPDSRLMCYVRLVFNHVYFQLFIAAIYPPILWLPPHELCRNTPVMTVSVVYFAFFVLGPRMTMNSRKPFKLVQEHVSFVSSRSCCKMHFWFAQCSYGEKTVGNNY